MTKIISDEEIQKIIRPVRLEFCKEEMLQNVAKSQRDSSDREWIEWLEENFSDWEKESDEFQTLKQKVKEQK